MFDLKTFKALGRIPAAEDADAIVYDPPSNRVFTLNGDAHSSTVIDAQAGTLVTNIPLGGKPEYGASALDGKVYANLTDTSEVVEIDAKSAGNTRSISRARNRSDPSGVAQHGARPHQSPCVHRFGKIRACACGWQGQRSGVTGIIRNDDY
jgi:DNA-binding beta-propeller fold protein YncE